jgi:glutaredoxin
MSDKIVLYTVPNCPLCAEAKRVLNRHGIKYDEHDVANNFGALRRMYKLTRQELVPVLVAGGIAKVRPKEDEIVQLCK